MRVIGFLGLNRAFDCSKLRLSMLYQYLTVAVMAQVNS